MYEITEEGKCEGTLQSAQGSATDDGRSRFAESLEESAEENDKAP